MDGMKDDLVLIKETIDGNKDAFAMLVEKYQDRIFNYSYQLVGNKQDAEDITQETFIKGYAHLRGFKIEYKLLSWLYTIATNITKNRIKRNKIVCYNLDVPNVTDTGEMIRDVPDTRSDTPESSVDKSVTAQLVSEMLGSLPDQYRPPFLLKHKEQLSYEEIAGILKLPVSTVKIRVYRAREWLLKKYKDKV